MCTQKRILLANSDPLKMCKQSSSWKIPVKVAHQTRNLTFSMALPVRRSPAIHIVLVRPQIPHNTGCAGRTSLAYGARLHLVGPLGFSLADKDVKRAGLDYWKHVDLCVYDDWQAFKKAPHFADLTRNMFFLSKFGKRSVLDAKLAKFDPKIPFDTSSPLDKESLYDRLLPTTLVFGSETKGLFQLLSEDEMIGLGEIIRLPIQDAGHRKYDTPSLNLATTVAIMAFETWRQQQTLIASYTNEKA